MNELLTSFVVSHHAFLDGKSIAELRQICVCSVPSTAQWVEARNLVRDNRTPENIEQCRQIHRKIFFKRTLPEIIRHRAGLTVLRSMRHHTKIRRRLRFKHIYVATPLPNPIVGEIAKDV